MCWGTHYFVSSLCSLIIVCLSFCEYCCFFLCLFNLFLLLCQKSKNHIKIRKSKVWLTLLSFCLKTCFALYLCANGFVHFQALLVSLHSYHCGRNLEIYMIVVNWSSILSWMISEWLWWSWDLHRLVSIYLPTFYFFLFLLRRAHQM